MTKEHKKEARKALAQLNKARLMVYRLTEELRAVDIDDDDFWHCDQCLLGIENAARHLEFE